MIIKLKSGNTMTINAGNVYIETRPACGSCSKGDGCEKKVKHILKNIHTDNAIGELEDVEALKLVTMVGDLDARRGIKQ